MTTTVTLIVVVFAVVAVSIFATETSRTRLTGRRPSMSQAKRPLLAPERRLLRDSKMSAIGAQS
jgi:hypothetical protein